MRSNTVSVIANLTAALRVARVGVWPLATQWADNVNVTGRKAQRTARAQRTASQGQPGQCFEAPITPLAVRTQYCTALLTTE